MANLAKPAFPQIDEYQTLDNLYDQTTFNLIPKGQPLPKTGPKHERNWFWYRTTFRAPARKQNAILRVGKAQFSTSVWLNGRKIGDHLGCYTAGFFDITAAMNWTGENTLVIRIGAHPGVMPEDVPSGTDYEKTKWTAGIYDSVTVQLSDNPVIETVQVAPRINPPSIVVQTVVRNPASTPEKVTLTQKVTKAKGGEAAATAPSMSLTLAAGETRTLTQTIPMPGAKFWSPEDPFLYRLDTSTGGDSSSTRFGVREFRFDTATKRAFLNGKPYFLRGSNITLHRFFEDPSVGSLPWNEAWVRKMLVEIPKQMNWNSFRFCIGPAPEKWLEIADESGLLIQNEFMIWTGGKTWPVLKKYKWNEAELTTQFKEWMRDHWNHPSVAIWDANNETGDDLFHEKIIPAVRGVDLSNRPWENSYNLPAGPDDPVEDHPYLFSRGTSGKGEIFDMAELERMRGEPPGGGQSPHGHAQILNEYGWLWLLRDGTPCVVSKPVYDKILGPDAGPKDRIELNHYYLAGLTEYWRAWRGYAGVLHFVYLTFCYPNAYTCDNWQDVANLKLHPQFLSYVREAFKPLGVYINFWQPSLAPGVEKTIHVMMINDYDAASAGALSLVLEDANGRSVLSKEQPFSLPPLGQATYAFKVTAPPGDGQYRLKAIAKPASGPATESTTSVRKVALRAAPAKQ
jgi:hypothetical protein